MNTVLGLVLVALGLRVMRPERPERRPSVTAPMSGLELRGLVDIDWADDLVLVTPRGVEIPFASGWDLDEVLDTLAEVDAL